MIRRLAVGLAIAASGTLAAAQPPAPNPGTAATLAPELKPFSFLLGEWNAASGPSGETGGFTFGVSVQGRTIVRTNYADYPAANGKPASRHDDLLVMAADGASVRADYFDSEGHVIRYAVRTPAAGQAVFESDVKPNEPRYRLRYTANADGTLSGAFEIAPPGKPDAFGAYLSWTARRKR